MLPEFYHIIKPDLRKNLNLRKIVGATDFLVHKLFDLRKIFYALKFDLRKFFFQKIGKKRHFLTILEQPLVVFSFFFLKFITLVLK